MGVHVYFNPYYLIPVVIFILILLWRLFRYKKMKAQQRRRETDASNPNASNIFPPPTAPSPAYPTESTGGGRFIQLELMRPPSYETGVAIDHNPESTGGGRFIQPELMKPPSYETAVAMDQNPGFGFDTAKYGGGFTNQATSSGQDYDPIRR